MAQAHIKTVCAQMPHWLMEHHLCKNCYYPYNSKISELVQCKYREWIAKTRDTCTNVEENWYCQNWKPRRTWQPKINWHIQYEPTLPF